MSIAKRWSNFNWEKLDKVPDVYGAFELAGSGKKVIYIGQGRIRDELMNYKRSDDPCKMKARKFRFEQERSEQRAEERERALLREYKKKHGRLLKCNKRIG